MSKGANIVLTIVFFVVFCAIGWFVPLDSLSVVNVDEAEEAVEVLPESSPQPVTRPSVQEREVSDVPFIKDDPHPVEGRNNLYTLEVKADVQSGDAVEYQLLNDKGDVVYTSNDGVFTNVKATSNGSYKLKAVNKRTGACSDVEVSGFKLTEKLQASQLQSWINSDYPPQSLYRNMSVGNLVIQVKKFDGKIERMTDVGALVSDRSALGVSYRIIGELQFDSSNKVKGFMVEEVNVE